MRESFGEADSMVSKLVFEPDVDHEKKKEKRQRAEPAPHVEDGHVGGAAESGALSNQNLADQKTAQDEKQFDAIKPAMTEDAKDAAEMRIEHDKSVRTDHAHDRGGPEQIEAEDAIGRGFLGDRMGSGRHGFREERVRLFPAVAYHFACIVRASTRVRSFAMPRLRRARCGISQRYSAMNQMCFSVVIQWSRSNRARFTGRE